MPQRFARKHSDDPAQEKIRAAKDAYNKNMRDVIALLIEFKKGINGRGSRTLGLPPSKIQNPLPENTVSSLNHITELYRQVADQALQIVEMQREYSETRRKTQPKQQLTSPQQEAAPKVATASLQPYIEVAGTRIPTRLAITPEEQSKGLMYEHNPSPMVFPYKSPTINKFWMKNTPAPLTIAFCFNNKIVHIAEGTPYSTQLIGPDIPTDLVVECEKGTLEKLNIKIGDPIFLIIP